MKHIVLRIGLLLAFTAFTALVENKTLAADRPNVVIILADDLGWGSVGCYGANPELVRTPHIDRLARDGRRFTDANTTSSVCSPTRYALMTGRYCWRTSLISEVLPTTAPLHIETTRLTIASMLRSQGYQCAAVGKWHLGYGTADRCDFTKELSPGPLDIGFDYHFGVPSNHGDVTGVYVENRWVAGLNRDSPTSPSPPYNSVGQQKGRGVRSLEINAPKRVDDQVMATLTDRVVDWIEQQTPENPFFLYFTPVAVHNPITPSKQTSGSSRGGSFCDFIHDLDLSVGRVLDVLDRQGLAENTLVIFTSDNGGVNKQNGNTPQNVARDAGLKPVGPFRGGKHDVWEGGFRVPCLVRWPGHVPAGTVCDEPISLVDTLASLAAITGHELPPASAGAEDSFDVSKAWLGQSYTNPLRPHLIVHSADGTFAIRRGEWKWIEGVPADDVKPAAKTLRADQMHRMLYNLREDLAESMDRSAGHDDAAGQLEALLNRYRDGGYSRELPPVVPKPPRPTSVLPPLTGTVRLSLPMNEIPPRPWSTSGGEWVARDGSVRTTAGDKGASLSGPLQLRDGVVEVQVLLQEANRLSLRFHTAEDSHSFRVVMTQTSLDITRNPDPRQPASEAVSLARQRVTFDSNEWQTLRITFQGKELTAELAGTALKAQDPVFEESKTRLHLIAFAGEAGLKQFLVADLPNRVQAPRPD